MTDFPLSSFTRFLDIPEAIFSDHIILPYLDLLSFLNLSETCKFFTKLSASPAFWLNFVAQFYPLFPPPDMKKHPRASFIARRRGDAACRQFLENADDIQSIWKGLGDSLSTKEYDGICRELRPFIEDCLLPSSVSALCESSLLDGPQQRTREGRMMLALYAINFHSTFLQFDRLLFNAFKGGDDADDDRKGKMEEGILLINRVYLSTPQLLNPTLVDGVKSTLDSLADQVRALLPPSAKADPMDCFVACKKVLFDFGLRGNAADYYNINNSLLSSVLETKLGIPMSLAVVFSLVSRRVGVDVDIIGLPGHIICASGDADGERLYFDVFHEDRSLLEMADIEGIVNSYSIEFHQSMLQPLSSMDVWARTLRNIENSLKHVAHKLISRQQQNEGKTPPYEMPLFLDIFRGQTKNLLVSHTSRKWNAARN
ncbi:hypothetical protein TrRE_jg7763 [Triparma retinervis]|uniref:Protein SirB1 N-terminal domain-containing protein n=1 Tax=Triparma retinervis TaxID=2557542 RepID=A0A9W7AIM2_9STRA|nr:hypothetical protein TrRE_jg7763 [Triparma retinervis]